MLGLSDLFDSLTGNRPAPPPPGRDDEADAAAILAQLKEKMPTLEQGKAWLKEARSDTSFLQLHQEALLAAVPALRMGATSAWIDLIEEQRWEPELGSDELVRLLAAMLAWQVAASQRALARLDIEASNLRSLVWTTLVGETERYLLDQSASDTVMTLLRTHTESVASLVELGATAPESDDVATDLIEATARWCRLTDQTAAHELLASRWRITDVAAIGVWYRAFGEQLQSA
jgi:hypothetical protein